MKRLLLLSVVLSVVAAVFAPDSALAGEPPEWGEPEQLGADLPSSWFPDIYADQTGRVLAVWSASLEEGDLNQTDNLAGAVVISELTEDGWTTPADIFVMHGGIASRPMIVSDGEYAHLIFRYGQAGAPVRLFYSRAPLGADLSNAHSWSPMQPISADEAYWAQLLLLPNGDLVVFYSQVVKESSNETAVRQLVLFARRSTDDGVTWGFPARISTDDNPVARISVAASPNGSRLVAAWDTGYDNMSGTGEPNGMATAWSDDGGLTWSEPRVHSDPLEQTTIAHNGEMALLVYRSTTEDLLYYQVSDDGGETWSESAEIPDAIARPYTTKHNFDKLSLIADSDGTFVLSWAGTDETSPSGLSVMVATYDSGEWTSPIAVASPEGSPEYPRLAVSGGNDFTLIYFVRDVVFDVGSYTLWAIDGRNDARAIAPVTVTPAMPVVVEADVVPTPVIFVRPTVRPVEAPEPGSLVIDRTPQDLTTQPLHTIAILTAVGLLTIFALVLVVRWQFRL